MSDPSQFIEKELESSQVPISYRLLSRKLCIHVNEAKNELNRYYEQSKSSERPLHATFMVTGETRASGSADEDEMDVDAPVDATHTTELKCLIVDGSNLEGVKASFSSVRSCHIYALSSFEQTTSGIGSANVSVRELDSSFKLDDLKKFGRALGSSQGARRPIKRVDVKTTPSSSTASTKETPKTKAPEPVQKPSPVVKEKPKATGKLDFFSKPKPKDSPVSKPAQPAAPPPTQEVPKQPIAKTTKTPVKKEQVEVPSIFTKGKQKDPEPKQQAKKEPSPEPAGPSVIVKKGALLSDDEDEEVKPKRRLRKRASSIAFDDSDSEREKSLRAMMDIDDSEVIRASTSNGKAVAKPEEPQESEPDVEESSQPADIAMDEDSDPAPKVKPRKRKEKKVIPVGRNGLKKKRIVKSRVTTDAKGYMATEDYSSYESVSEEEVEKPAKSESSNPKEKAKEPTKKTPVAKTQQKIATPAPKAAAKPVKQSGDPKRRPSTGGNQKSLMNFFGGGKKQ